MSLIEILLKLEADIRIGGVLDSKYLSIVLKILALRLSGRKVLDIGGKPVSLLKRRRPNVTILIHVVHLLLVIKEL